MHLQKSIDQIQAAEAAQIDQGLNTLLLLDFLNVKTSFHLFIHLVIAHKRFDR